MKNIEQVLAFIVEIEKLKAIYRGSKPVGLDRYENAAEHSWHVCLSALMLKDFANNTINIDRVIKMLLIHDLGEIDAGDTIVYAADTQAVKAEETAGVQRILSLLPEEKAQQYFALWQEFEAGITNDAKYAKAIDRVPPLLHNLYGNGHSWKENAITPKQVLSLNSRIAQGSEELWQVLQTQINDVIDNGEFKSPFE